MSRYPVIVVCFFFFFFNDTATTEIYTLSLHDALPILRLSRGQQRDDRGVALVHRAAGDVRGELHGHHQRSEEHTSELQSQFHLVCRLLLEKKKKTKTKTPSSTDTTLQTNAERRLLQAS